MLACDRRMQEEKRNDAVETINISKYRNEITVDLTELCDSLTIIPFNIKSPIGDIEKIIIRNEKIYIWDKYDEKIWGFKNNGDSLFCINNQGKGPGEYIRIGDVTVSDSDEINLLDIERKTILYYDVQGEFIGQRHFNTWVHLYCCVAGYEYLFSATPDQPNGNYVDVFKESNKCKSYFPSNHNWHFDKTEFLRSEDSLFFTRRYDDYIYYFRDGILKEAYYIDFGNDSIFLKKLREAGTLDEHKKILKTNKYRGDIQDLSVSDTHITFNYIEPVGDWNVVTHFFYNRNTKTGLSFKSFGDSNKAYYSMGTPIASDGHYFYALIQPWSLSENQKRQLEQELKTPLDKNLNYLLARFTIKL